MELPAAKTVPSLLLFGSPQRGSGFGVSASFVALETTDFPLQQTLVQYTLCHNYFTLEHVTTSITEQQP
jgi:hypothetical protein